MAFNYDCDFSLQAQRLTPITKRQDIRLGILDAISEPIQWNRDNFFDSYLEGDDSDVWDVGTNYVRYDRVNYQNMIYECTNDILGELPTNTDYWVKVLGDFRGATERIKYNCQKIMLEWMLNKWFGTTFNQPSTLLNSDFYIVDNARVGNTFTVYENSEIGGEYAASSVYDDTTLTGEWIYEEPGYTTDTPNFTVYYKLTDIPSTSNMKYFQMTDLVNKYKIYGSTVAYIGY